jgi:hypothetical protein
MNLNSRPSPSFHSSCPKSSWSFCGHPITEAGLREFQSQKTGPGRLAAQKEDRLERGGDKPHSTWDPRWLQGLQTSQTPVCTDTRTCLRTGMHVNTPTYICIHTTHT